MTLYHDASKAKHVDDRVEIKHAVPEGASATVETTEHIEITTPKEVCGMGHRMKRKEDPRFIRGKGNYVDDIKMPGMLYMDIVRSPYAHAKILEIDASAALEMDGVLAVITGKDLEAHGLHWMPTLMSDTQMVLPTEKVVYYAQEVCAVIATDRYIAADAIEQVFVDYEPLPPVVDPFKALRTRRLSALTKSYRRTAFGTGKWATKTQQTRFLTTQPTSSKSTYTSRASTFHQLRRAVWSPTTIRRRARCRST